MEQLTLSIKPKLEPSGEQCLLSSGYTVKIGNWVLDKGVKKMTLEMDASKKPILTIEAEVDRMDIDAIHGLDLELVDTSGHQNQALSSNQLAELVELRSLKRLEHNYKALQHQLSQKEKQNSVLSVALIGLVIVLLLFTYR